MEKEKLKSYKEKQYLVFEFEDGKKVKYNLATGESIGKSGRVVKDIKTQLSGYNLLEIIDSFEDKNYKEFLLFVDKQVNKSSLWSHRVDKIRNIGTFLQHIKPYSHMEQFFACGINNISRDLTYSFSNVTKGLLKIIKDSGYKVDDNLIRSYNSNPNLFLNIYNLLKQNKVLNLNKSIIKEILYNLYRLEDKSIDGYRVPSYVRRCFQLVIEYNYSLIPLILYLDRLATYEALTDIYLVSELYDYVNMMNTISNKYEKFPKNFLTTHKIAIRNYNRLKQEYSEEIFKQRFNSQLEYQVDDYVFIYPKETQEIKDEAVQQNNCVSSYIDKVIDNKCDIIFMRKKEEPEKSAVTIEIRNGEVVQALRHYNYELTSEQKKILNKYKKRLERVLKNEKKCA